MIAMMDAMGDLAHRFKGSGGGTFGNSYLPYSSFSGLSGNPLSPYAFPGGAMPGTGWPYGLPLQSPVPGLSKLPEAGGLPFNPLPSQPAPSVSPVDGIWVIYFPLS